MQSVHHPVYTYDALGRLVNYTPSGATNDVVRKHVLLDPRIPGPRSLIAGGLRPVQMQGTNATGVDRLDTQQHVLNAPHLYVPPLSLTSPPVSRPKTVASKLGYAAFKDHPETQDAFAITTSEPLVRL